MNVASIFQFSFCISSSGINQILQIPGGVLGKNSNSKE